MSACTRVTTTAAAAAAGTPHLPHLLFVFNEVPLYALSSIEQVALAVQHQQH
jgi:hypothetical protein